MPVSVQRHSRGERRGLAEKLACVPWNLEKASFEPPPAIIGRARTAAKAVNTSACITGCSDVWHGVDDAASSDGVVVCLATG